MLENGLDVLVSHQDQAGRGPGFVLGNAGAEILLTKESNAERALAMVQGELGQNVIEDNHSEEVTDMNEALTCLKENNDGRKISPASPADCSAS